MCDQFYGMANQPGGGLYVLSNPFKGEPAVRDVLAGSVVENGRLKGTKLGGGPVRRWNISFDGMGNQNGEKTEGGSFLSPDLSYDGRQILFAYVECTGDTKLMHHLERNRGYWPEGRSYHIFKVNSDGTGLVQLTDGTWNEFDPCWLPGGKIAFISERRGGYLRCGRVCPTYTLYRMDADGKNIRCLDPHETNEWQPSVSHDGMIVYTRWDYIDRSAMVAHAPWIITPDGRDPRAIQGNYSLRHTRPEMELDIRAIPGSRLFAATAAPHHGQSFGSIIVFDPSIPDDNNLAPVKRVTPDVGFPETQKGTETYGQVWPLSEDFYLCAYDPAMEVSEITPKGNYGIYLVDSFGNRELIYRDPDIGCQSPMPFVPRKMPPMLPDQSDYSADGTGKAVVSVANCYKTTHRLPRGTKIKALRIYQALPMTVPSGAPPHDPGFRCSMDSVNIARALLGTVPVEEDGTAYFEVPALKELYFQAVDENGLAIISMRSETHFQPGEKASCQGCHEPRHGVPSVNQSKLLALNRSPSLIQPGPDGSNPFSYPRLVQPVLDKNCVSCHDKNPDKAPKLDREIVIKEGEAWMKSKSPYFRSYMNLSKFAFFRYPESSVETLPGKFGARVAPLYGMLTKGHHDLKLSVEDMSRITLWLDSCSPFYGVYEKAGAEAQLRGEVAHPVLE
jgi:hypothetical protein